MITNSVHILDETEEDEDYEAEEITDTTPGPFCEDQEIDTERDEGDPEELHFD